MEINKSIFSKYISSGELDIEDRFIGDKANAVDVIIPVLNTNDLWEVNLKSFYKEIPINSLLVGDGGCTDDTLAVLERFPRVQVVSLKDTSLGYRIRKLIEIVTTEHFVYLHSDVYLPQSWFDVMESKKSEYDWFESGRTETYLVSQNVDIHSYERPLSGSQFGRTAIMKEVSCVIDDDYSYRQEDIIFRELLRDKGGRYGKVSDTFHYHQIMDKPGAEVPDWESVSVKRKPDSEIEKMIFTTQIKGYVKYLDPNKEYFIENANYALFMLDKLDALDWSEFKLWVAEVNPGWLKVLNKKGTIKQRVKHFLKQKRLLG
jgi:glycosyltransferase involved in cell wall biosynthesis